MNYYFLIRIDGLDSAVTLVNYPCVDGQRESIDQFVYVTWSDGKNWQIRERGGIKAGDIRRVTGNDLPGDCPEDASTFFFLHPDSLPKSNDTLITSNHMHTMPTWRGNIQIISKTTQVSFQGEYPGGMTKIPRGSLVSFSHMFQLGKGIKNKLILPNLKLSPEIEQGILHFVSSKQRKVLYSVPILTNTINVTEFDLAPGEDIEEDDMIISLTGDMAGIPIYFSHTENYSEMSLEHSHPPASYGIFGNTGLLQSKMKTWWLSHILQGDGAVGRVAEKA